MQTPDLSYSFRRIIDEIVFGNFYIACCVCGLIFSTLMLNDLPFYFSPLVVFLTSATFLHYNFHAYSFQLDFSGWEKFIDSVSRIKISKVVRTFYFVAALCMVISLFLLPATVLTFLIPMTFFSVAYSFPLFRLHGKWFRLSEFLFVKTPLVAVVWGVSTTVLPLLEYDKSVLTEFVFLQVASRCLFVFALCIPFEIRDMEEDKKRGIRTLPIVYGIQRTKLIGIFAIVFEIFLHHLMKEIPLAAMVALDLSSLFAVLWILFNKKTGTYFYKVFVDGTMLLRFLFLLIAIY